MRLAGALALALALAAAPAAAELRRVEIEGLAAADDGGAGAGALREAALRAGVAAAVDQVALELLRDAGRLPPGLAPPELGPILGGARSDYAARFRILRDEGPRGAAPGVDGAGWAVMAEVFVEVDRVRARLVEAGLLAPAAAPVAESRRVHVVLEGLASYRGYAWARRTLVEAGAAASALPVELERGRAVLAVETDREADALARTLAAAVPAGWRVDVVALDSASVTLRIAEAPPAAPPPAP